MAAADVEPFSIRGYAARMRAAGAAKCWPFGGEEAAAPLLPPMAVPRFRWWGHEFAAARAKLEERVNGGEEVRGGNGCKEGVLEERRKRSRGDGGMESAKKRRRLLQMSIFLKHQEKTHKPRSTSPLCISRLLQRTLHSRLLSKRISSTAHARRKLAVMKKLSTTHGLSLNQSNSFTVRNQNRIATDHPVGSFLRKKKANSFVKKPSLKANKSAGSLLKPCCEVEKHVTYPVKDDIFGDLPLLESSKIMFSSEGDELPTAIEEPFVAKQSGADVMPETALSKFTPASGTKDHMSPLLEDARHNSTANKELTCISENKQPTKLCSHPSSAGLDGPVIYSSIDMIKRCSGESVDLNHVMQKSNLHCTSPGDIASPLMQLKSIDVPALSSYSEEGSKSGFSKPAQECFRMTIDCSQEISTPGISSSATSSAALKTRTEAIAKESDSSVDGKKSTKISDPLVPTKYHLSAKDSISSSARSHRTGNAELKADNMPSCRNMPSNEDFTSFPPNSQEKIVKTHSDVIRDGEHARVVRHHYPAKDSAFSFPTSSLFSNFESSIGHVNMKSALPGASSLTEDQGSWYSKLHPVSTPASFGLAFMKLPGLERMEISNCNPRTNEDKSVNCGRSISITSRHQQEQASTITNSKQDQARIVTHKSQLRKTSLDGYLRQDVHHPHQPTVRLMGKTVTICERSKEHRGLTDWKVWADKKIITEGGQPTSISGQLPQKILVACQDSGTSRGHGMESLEFSSMISNSSASETRLNSGDLHSQQLPPTSCISSSVNSYNSNAGSQFPPQAEVNNASMVTVNSKIRSPEVHQLPPAATFSHNRVSPLCTSASHRHRENQNFVDPAANQSSPCFPQWVLNMNMQEKYQKSTLLSYDDPSSVPIRQPCLVPGTKLSSTSIISFADYSINNAQPRNTASLLHPSLIPTNLVSKSISAVAPTYTGNFANVDCMMCELTKGAACAHQRNKRLAGVDDVLLRPAKKPHVTEQKAVKIPIVPNIRNHLSGWSLSDAVGRQMFDFSNRIGEVGTQVTSNEKNGLRINTGSNPVAETRSGTVRLIAGAKHILKPGQNLDDDNSKTLYSTFKFIVENGVNSVIS